MSFTSPWPVDCAGGSERGLDSWLGGFLVPWRPWRICSVSILDTSDTSKVDLSQVNWCGVNTRNLTLSLVSLFFFFLESQMKSRHVASLDRPMSNGKCSKIPTFSGWWFETVFIFPRYWELLGMSSSQLTFTPSFFRGLGLNHQPVVEFSTTGCSGESHREPCEPTRVRSERAQGRAWRFVPKVPRGWHDSDPLRIHGAGIFTRPGELTFCHGKAPFLMGKSTIYRWWILTPTNWDYPAW